MANNPAKVAVGTPLATGGAYTAVAGTVLPTSESGALNAAFKLTGLVSQDGLVQHIGTNTNDIIAWNGDTVRTVQTTQDVTYDITFLETNGVTQGVYYGTANVTVTAAGPAVGEKIVTTVTSAVLPTGPYVFELKDGLRVTRVVLPSAQVVKQGDVKFVASDAVSYPVTLKAFPDSTGVKAYIYNNDGVFVP